MQGVDGGPALRGGDDAGDDPVRPEPLRDLADGVAGLLLVGGVGDEDRGGVAGQHVGGVGEQSGEVVGGGGQVGAGGQGEDASGGSLVQVQRAQGFGRVEADQRGHDVEDVGGAAQPDPGGLAVLVGLVVVVAAHRDGASPVVGSAVGALVAPPVFSPCWVIG